MEDFLSKIAPGITLYAVLVTLGILAIKIASYFKEKEAKIYDNYLNMFTKLKREFRSTYIEPIIGKNIDSSVKQTFESSLKLFDKLLRNEDGELFENDKIKEVLKSSLIKRTQDNLLNRITDDNPSLSASKFLESGIGTEFLEAVEKNISKSSNVIIYYKKIKYYLKFVYIILFLLGITFFGGLLKLLFEETPSYISISYINFVVLLILFSIYGIIRFFNAEQSFLDLYENSKLYPKTGDEI